jgi:hypothetical protein
LQLVVGHCDDGQDQVDEVERTEEDVEHEEDDVVRAGRSQRDLTFKSTFVIFKPRLRKKQNLQNRCTLNKSKYFSLL